MTVRSSADVATMIIVNPFSLAILILCGVLSSCALLNQQEVFLLGGQTSMRAPSDLLEPEVVEGAKRYKSAKEGDTVPASDQRSYLAARGTQVTGRSRELKLTTATHDKDLNGTTGRIGLALQVGYTSFDRDSYDRSNNSVIIQDALSATSASLLFDACVLSNWVIHFCTNFLGYRSVTFITADDRFTEGSFIMLIPYSSHIGGLLDFWVPIRLGDHHRFLIGGSRVEFNTDPDWLGANMSHIYVGYSLIFGAKPSR